MNYSAAFDNFDTMSYLLETERLTIRKFTKSDAVFVCALLNTPGWLQFIGDRNIRTVPDAESYIQTLEDHHSQHGFGPVLVSEKETSLPLGMCSLIKRESLEQVDIGFAFMPEHMGQGYAYEATQGIYHYAKQNLGLLKICAITNTDNFASIKLLQKMGFVLEKEVILDGETEPLLLFNDSK